MLILRPKAAWLEAVLLLVCAAISLARPRLGARWFRALAGRAVLASRFPVSVPRIHDEYSYLLAADTFSSGRLRNPPHPQWTAKWLNYSWYYFIPNTAPREQWIARLNKIEVDASKIVWAPDLGPAGHQPLIEYFRSRRVWWMDAR